MPSVAFPRLANLLALPNGWACGLGVSDQSAAPYVDDNYSTISFATGPVVVSTGWVALYIITAEELGHFTDGLDPDARYANAAARFGAATLANQIARLPGAGQVLRPLTTYTFGGFSIKAVIGATPALTAPIIWNNAGGPLSTRVMPHAAHTVQS